MVFAKLTFPKIHHKKLCYPIGITPTTINSESKPGQLPWLTLYQISILTEKAVSHPYVIAFNLNNLSLRMPESSCQLID